MELKDLLLQFIKLQRKYQDLMGLELGELAIMASNRRWGSKRVQDGVEFREKLDELESQIKEEYNINLFKD